MKLGLERCAELLANMQEDDTPTTYTYMTCPYTLRTCYSSGISCEGCFNFPQVRYTTTSKKEY